MTKRQLVLEDGTVFEGKAFGGVEIKSGDVIFNTGVTGYQEIITDPNYAGSLVVMTYPVIGTYGINRDDHESIDPYINGLIVKELTEVPSNFRNEETLQDFLKKHNIPGISGIDTRKLTRHLRENGTMRGVITDVETDETTIKAQIAVEKTSLELVEKTSITKPYIIPGRGTRMVVIDLGMKHTILRALTEKNCHITVVPYNFEAEEIMRFNPDGIMLSNGPGNPNDLSETIAIVKELLGKVPLFGIGLGHQLFALAAGAKVEKMHVGHFGPGFPVKELAQDKAWLTTQSRQYTVNESSLDTTDLKVTFLSLNDGTVEGLTHTKHKASSVQFNPEGAPGPSETSFLFDAFLEEIQENKQMNGVDYHA